MLHALLDVCGDVAQANVDQHNGSDESDWQHSEHAHERHQSASPGTPRGRGRGSVHSPPCKDLVRLVVDIGQHRQDSAEPGETDDGQQDGHP